MNGRSVADREETSAKVRERELVELERRVVERERQLAGEYKRWLEQWVPNTEDGTH